MPPVGFEPTISEGKRQQTYALDNAANGTVNNIYELTILKCISNNSWIVRSRGVKIQYRHKKRQTNLTQIIHWNFGNMFRHR